MEGMKQTGGFVCSITPFDSNDKLDETALRQHIRRMAAAGLGVYLGSPGVGEGHTLSLSEIRRIYDIGVEELKGKVPVYASGFEPRSAHTLIEVGRAAASAGLDAWQIYPLDGGHAMRPTPAEVEQYYRDILSAVKLPALLSVHIASVGYLLPVEVVKRLVQDYEIIGINVFPAEIGYLVDVHRALGSKIAIYSGHTNTITNLALGGKGFMDFSSNIAPKLCISVINHFRSGDIAKAGRAYMKVMKLNSILHNAFPEGTARVTKVAMNILGMPGGYLRRPYIMPDEAAQNKLAQALKEFDILSTESLA